ncbi:DNA polymerase III subunit gamma/tau [Candidatus Binatia bacterium]|nr:DNA polymerase III subunit gamma/tau [Candidatus Binatia bacterium]
MSYLVLARKWRPQTFEEIVGQDHVSRTLGNAIRTGRVAHAFLFTGVRGVGKTTAARILAKALNCTRGPTPTPCNDCVNCREITAGNAVDVLEIDGASNTGVDDVREIIENVRYQPAKSRFKIYIIDEVHMLSTSAFNALLKTLEEPPPHVKFIFATTDPHKVPHTIHSRCQRYDFKRIPYRLIVERLADIARHEDVTVSEAALFTIAREGEGSMRDAQSLFDQVIAYAGNTVGDADIGAALGVADRKLLLNTADALLTHDAGAALARLDELHSFGHDLRRFTRELLEHFRNLAIARLVPDESLLADLSEDERAETLRQSQLASSADLDRAFRVLMTAETEVARVPYPKLVLEMTLIKLATMAPIVPLDTLIERLDEIERRLLTPSTAGTPPRRTGDAPAPAKTSHRESAPATGTTRPAGSSSTATAARPAPAAPATGDDSTIESAAPDAQPARETPGRSWEDFLATVAKEKVTLLPYLLKSAPPNLEGPELALSVPSGYYYDYLAQRDHAQIVEDLARRFFGRSYRVSVRTSEAAPAAPASGTAPTAADLHAAAMDHPAVRAAVEILGGEVHEIKPRGRRDRGGE